MAGETPSRRDDLISLGYVYARALALPAPWDTFVDGKEANLDHASMVAVAREKRRAIRGGMGDARLKTYMHACHSLGYADAPDYAALQKIFAKEA
jgi:hypothetical protein